MFGVFQVGQTSLQPHTRQFYKNYSQNHFFLKKIDFCKFNPKNFEVKENCSKTPLNFRPLKCTYIGKNSFRFYQRLIRINEFEKLPIKLGDNCIQNFHLGRYIAGYTVANLGRYPIRSRVAFASALEYWFKYRENRLLYFNCLNDVF